MLIAYILGALVIGGVICVAVGGTRPWIAQAAFAGVVVASVVTAAKLVTVTEGVVVSVAIGLYSISFLLTDYLGEIFGRREALKALLMGIVAQVIFLFAVVFSVAIDPVPFWSDNQSAYAAVLGATPRIVAASMLAFVCAQLCDITTFDWLKRRTKGKLLFVRNNASTLVGQTVDTVIFYTVAFYGVPGVDLLPLIAVTLVVKVAIAVLDTPVLYFAVNLARREGRG